MKLERKLSQWANMNPKAAASMSQAAVTFLAADAQKDIAALAAEVERLRGAMKEASDLLAERIYGNAARSSSHNARVVMEYALSTPTSQP